MGDAFDELNQRLSAEPEIRTDLERFKSGTIMLDVFQGDRFFTLLYRQQYGYGVDEILEDEDIPPFSDYYRYWFPTFDEAANKLAELMSHPPASPAPIVSPQSAARVSPAVTPVVELNNVPTATPPQQS